MCLEGVFKCWFYQTLQMRNDVMLIRFFFSIQTLTWEHFYSHKDDIRMVFQMYEPSLYDFVRLFFLYKFENHKIRIEESLFWHCHGILYHQDLLYVFFVYALFFKIQLLCNQFPLTQTTEIVLSEFSEFSLVTILLQMVT